MLKVLIADSNHHHQAATRHAYPSTSHGFTQLSSTAALPEHNMHPEKELATEGTAVVSK